MDHYYLIPEVAFEIGSLSVRWYGIILTSALLIALFYCIREAKRISLTTDNLVEIFFWVVPLAIIMARVVYVLVRPDEYLPVKSWDDFVRFWAIWEGGITIIGGILGGGIGAAVYCAVRKKNFLKLCDLIVPALVLAQALGRWGNFINQEAFGVAITDPKLQWLPFAVYIDAINGYAAGGYAEGWYAATFFYEMVWNLLGFALFFVIWRKNKKAPGLLLFLYFLWYFIARGFLEMIRLDAVVTSGGAPLTLIVSFVAAGIGAAAGVIYYILAKKRFDAKDLKENGLPTRKAGDISADVWGE
ncbi:MAG: prolipoprotein diacylglyceryl transferase [Clostridiales bacterium]|jgi:phosphatidylglycerol:prolipoprotein diacylglycerol transferase|nr:prolipoprotein diacylglyceryl transferase [Clostridiales bacterium]